MTTTRKLVVAAVCAGLASAHAFGQETAFTKRGAAAAVQKRDSDRCWRLAQKRRLTDEEATQNLVAAYLVGGIVGVLIVSATNEEANKDPKSTYRRQAHDACMLKQGYRKVE